MTALELTAGAWGGLWRPVEVDAKWTRQLGRSSWVSLGVCGPEIACLSPGGHPQPGRLGMSGRSCGQSVDLSTFLAVGPRLPDT